MTKTNVKPKLTPEERRARIDALRARYEAFIEEAGPILLAELAAKFDGYSDRNAHLIGMQRPSATDVRGFREWINHGRRVRKGEKGIAILAPIVRKGEDPEDGELAAVKIVHVFDVTQTDPLDGEAPS